MNTDFYRSKAQKSKKLEQERTGETEGFLSPLALCALRYLLLNKGFIRSRAFILDGGWAFGY